MFYLPVIFTIVSVFFADLSGQYVQREHENLPEGVVPINDPGCYDLPGTTYMLTSDISCDRSTLFLGKDVTLDLNGYTLTYADGDYEHVHNYGFEEGLDGWDVSKAPGAKIENTADVHQFIGQKLLSLKAGDMISSEYINLPVAGRSY